MTSSKTSIFTFKIHFQLNIDIAPCKQYLYLIENQNYSKNLAQKRELFLIVLLSQHLFLYDLIFFEKVGDSLELQEAFYSISIKQS